MRSLLLLAMLLSLGACGAATTVRLPQPTPDPAAAARRGEVLFVNKGCVTCHRHDGLRQPFTSFEQGPNLTISSLTPAFLRLWLADPRGVRPATRMPNLQLTGSEIEDLIAFLTTQQ